MMRRDLNLWLVHGFSPGGVVSLLQDVAVDMDIRWGLLENAGQNLE